MTTALTERPSVSKDELDLVKRTVANGATDAELKLYLYDCQRQGVHPLDRLLHFTKRGGKYTPVTSIDLMRIRAAETGEYAGSDDVVFSTPETLNPAHEHLTATVTVWRLVQGQRCAFTATARWSEYFPGDQSGHMWRKMPHTMLGKCAEALALRKGFPRQLAGLYAAEELQQADRPAPAVAPPPAAAVVSPSVPNGGELGTPPIDLTTGEEAPTGYHFISDYRAPTGYHFISDYRFENGWHDVTVLGMDAQGGAMRLSTKKDIGFIAEQAFAEHVPVKVTWQAKPRGKSGEGYLNSIEKYVTPDDDGGDDLPDLTDADIPF